MTKNTIDYLDNFISIILRLKSIFVLLLSILLIIKCCNGTQSLNNDDCPIYCTCNIWYRLSWASCAGKRLINVHTGVSKNVEALDLSNNSISKLSDYELMTIGMKNLKYLNLSDNAISNVDLFAFAHLNELTILDLSRNHFNYLHSDVFIDNNKLRILKLGGNNFHNGVPYLKNPTITELDLSGCQISHLEMGIFNGVKQLKNLDISNNILIQLDIGIIKTLSSLKILKIARNPWLCNNAMNLLKLYLNTKLILYNSSICGEKIQDFSGNNVKFQRITLKNNENNNLQQNTNNKFISMLNNKNNHHDLWENPTVKLSTIDKNNCSNNNIHKSSNLTTIEFPMWFFIAGFIIGCALGMISIYSWLSWQQLNLSRQFPLLDNISIQSDETLPTYCEVMLHSNRYPQI
ncbi:hypothetical protein PV327_010823 [Microctonus hyperodae]|uniref:Uncharacterized protein n=1 Tax=Microctonus hyperodae TaxID=165561 RepID=A0AA39C893_MICHY|nr:hypothetical protein PV327_010823 [Microctonus hyperodae]